MRIHEILANEFGDNRVLRDKDLFPDLTLRTNVAAQYYFEAKTRDELIRAASIAKKEKASYLLIGGGSNVAVTKKRIEGIVIKNSYRAMDMLGESKGLTEVAISSGSLMSVIVSSTIEKGLEGFEYHKGLPGTVGGAVYMNSKWTRPWTYVGDNLLRGVIIDEEGELKEVDHDYFQFAYDYSKLQDTKEIFIEGVFGLRKQDPLILKERAQGAFDYRSKTQPHGVATCGCFFRNISVKDKERLNLATTSAGFLIDQSGMKNESVGSFSVSNVHANFIVNNGKREGNTQDLLQLISLIKGKVKQKYGIALHEEVVII